MSTYMVFHRCYECDFEDELPIVNGIVQCPQCDTKNDVWFDGDRVPKRHKDLEKKHKVMRKLLRYGKEE